MPETDPRRAPVIRRAVNQHRQRERQSQPAGEQLEPRPAQAVETEIARQRQQHHVAEAEPGDADLQPLPLPPARSFPTLAPVEFAKRQRRLVTQRRQQRRDLTQLHLRPVERDAHLAPGKVHPRFTDAGAQPKQILQQPHTRHAMNRRQMQRDLRSLLIREVEELLLHRRVIEKSPLPLRRRQTHARTGRGSQFIELAQPAFRQQRENGLASQAAEVTPLIDEGAARTPFAAVVAVRQLAVCAGRRDPTGSVRRLLICFGVVHGRRDARSIHRAELQGIRHGRLRSLWHGLNIFCEVITNVQSPLRKNVRRPPGVFALMPPASPCVVLHGDWPPLAANCRNLISDGPRNGQPIPRPA